MKIALTGVVLLGVFGVFFFGYFTMQDYRMLQRAFAVLENLASRNADMNTLLIAEAKHNAYRINVFADGTWTMLSGVIAAIGLNGLANLKRQEVSRA